SSATGRVIRTGEPFLTDDILSEADAQRALSPSGMARAAMIAPLRTSSGVAGAVGVVRYLRTAAEEPLPFTLMELQYLTAVAAYIAGGLELSEAVSGARAAVARAGARDPAVRGSPHLRLHHHRALGRRTGQPVGGAVRPDRRAARAARADRAREARDRRRDRQRRRARGEQPAGGDPDGGGAA